MRNEKYKIRHFFFCTLLAALCSLLLISCGYHMVGSKPLPFESITIKSVHNKTYEPKLDDRLHNALSREFIAQGIKVISKNGDVQMEAVITAFELSSIAAISETVQEQVIKMTVDIRLIDSGRVTEFTSTESPIRITFPTTGTVIESVVQKEKAIDKACSEIAKEIISRIIIKYVK
ncbi:MAG: LPS assembly lipoprotein LptE [Candidatus Mariimomonas ferrooxydans]